MVTKIRKYLDEAHVIQLRDALMKVLRHEGITMQEAALRIGIPLTVFNNFLHNKRVTQERNIGKIERFLGLQFSLPKNKED